MDTTYFHDANSKNLISFDNPAENEVANKSPDVLTQANNQLWISLRLLCISLSTASFQIHCRMNENDFIQSNDCDEWGLIKSNLICLLKCSASMHSDVCILR